MALFTDREVFAVVVVVVAVVTDDIRHSANVVACCTAQRRRPARIALTAVFVTWNITFVFFQLQFLPLANVA